MTPFLGGLAARLLAGALLAILLGGGFLWAVSGVRGCIQAQDKAAVLEEAQEMFEEARDEESRIEQETEQMSDDELAESFRSGGAGRVRGR